ncbi:HEAT repeat-containing protein 5B isoform X2 [Chrysoperla carnea]|uniref:HEAT repeat-containing protein 5B isoform X2 n=1 Tax=Chrysoperla carnea TaxID=189513 RepID=UPI001D06113F|nr:HEAT repeat-containing protein 5B isoform X2 [Chrysoperla carnea]
MMELSHSLTLNEDALKQIPEAKRPIFVFEWLRFLDKVLTAAQQSDIKDCQKKLVEQLMNRINEAPGPSTRKLIARCLATLFSVGDTFLLFDTVNKCNDILKNKNDSPSFQASRIAAICCVGYMYKKLGRMMGRSYEETVMILVRTLRGAESQTRVEIILTLEKVCAGMGNAINNVHKEIYKACRHSLIDRVMAVRCAAARCLLELLNHATFLHTTELESLATLCFRAFDGSNYEARLAIAKFLGALIAATQQKQKQQFTTAPQAKGIKVVSLDEALGVLMSGFLRGGSGFLKGTGEIIKGSGGINREVRLGVTHAYVIFVQILGGPWLERNITAFLNHVLDLVANPKAASSHVDAVYSRRCVNFILRSVLGKMLGEKAQTSACKEIVHNIIKQMKSIDFNAENVKDLNQETLFSQHLLVCALQELGCLIQSLGTTAQILLSDNTLNLVDTIMTVFVHPCQAARLAAAWCLRCVCVAVPTQITPLIDRCVNNIEVMRTSPEAISGNSAGLAAILSSVRYSPLGVPHMKGKVIFNTAEELLRSANQNSRLSLNRTEAGWLLIGAIMTLGVPVVRGLLPRMLLLWRNAFPRSNTELENEKARGDSFTWQVTLEGRAGALSAIHSLMLHCPDILTDDVLRRLLIPIECALAMLTNLSSVLKTYGQTLKAPAAMVRLRLYETLLLFPPQSFEASYTHLLRMLVTEFTLTENHANTTTSLLRSVCHIEESVILGSWLQESDHRTIEDQVHSYSAAGSGALEHDSCCLYRPLPPSDLVPGPLPLGVAVIDQSIQLFGQIFCRVANKHRLQMLEHFTECIKHTKASRQEATQINIFAAVLSGLKGFTESKTEFGQEDVKKSASALIMSALISPNPILRCSAGESVGRLAQVVGDTRLTGELAQSSFDRLKSARDVASRTGHSLALGCLHRYVGGMGSSQYLNTSVSILLALAQDTTSAIVQVWALHALALISDSGGPMFRGYVEPSLSLILKLLLNVPQSNVDVHQCIGKVLSSLITTIGPELQGNTTMICTARSSFLCACAIMQDHPDPLVQAEATGCLQQLHLFAPRHLNLSSLVPTLCRILSSNHLLLRKAAISCLRQLVQREAKEVCELAMTLANESRDATNTVEGLVITETGLPGVLFSMLDTETDTKLIKDIHETLTSMLQVLAADNVTQWLGICKDVLTISTEERTSIEGSENDDVCEDEDDDHVDLSVGGDEQASAGSVQPRWPTRVFAAQCVRRIIASCKSSNASPAHFDLHAAKENKTAKNDFLVLHISNLIRMAFIAATSDSDQLRLEGLKTLQEIIENFSSVPEPEFPGYLLLEQFQAQVSAALRPAFSPETPSHVTAAACDVCSTWISSGVARDLNDLRRVHQLLVSSLTKLQWRNNNVQLHNESLSTLEKLAILKAWAQVYIVAITGNKSVRDIAGNTEKKIDDSLSQNGENESLLSLVQPQLVSLSKYWFAALRDYALISLPPEFSSQLPRDGGAFYTNDTVYSSRGHYLVLWPPILHAAALWLTKNVNNPDTDRDDQIDNVCNDESDRRNENIQFVNTISDKFYLLFGICMKTLSAPNVSESLDKVMQCLQGLLSLVSSEWAQSLLIADGAYPIELCSVLYRLLMVHDNHTAQILCVKIVMHIIDALQKQLDQGEATEDDIAAITEAIICVTFGILVRHFPQIQPRISASLGVTVSQSATNHDLSGIVVATCFQMLERIPQLCTQKEQAIEIVSLILYLITEVIREYATKCNNNPVNNHVPVQAILQCLRTIAAQGTKQESDEWTNLLKSALGKIIGFAKISAEEEKIDEITIMLTIGVFAIHAPLEVVCTPSLLYPCINYINQCFQSENLTVKTKSIQTLRSILMQSETNIKVAYVRAMGPVLIERLHSDSARLILTESELLVTLEIIGTIEILVNLASINYRNHILSMVVAILVSFLLDPKERASSNKFGVSLHDNSLQWLMKIGPKYPQEFKVVIGQSMHMKTKLENAIRSTQQTQVKIESPTKNNTLQQPSIKLKTDFSNFS